MAATARQAVLQAVGEELHDLESGTATGGDTNTLIDTSDDSPFSAGHSVDAMVGRRLYVHTGTHAGVERLINVYTPSARSVDTADAVTGAYDATDQYHVLKYLSWPDRVLALNKVLTETCQYRWESPLTLVRDGDMEENNTTYWSVSGATRAKVTTSALVRAGVRALEVTHTAADDYAYNATNVPVRADTQYRIEAWARTVSTTAGSTMSFLVRDIANSATITLSGYPSWKAADGQDWVRLWATFQTPSSCNRIQIRLSSNKAGDVTYWDDVILWCPSDLQVPLPIWCDDGSKFEWLWYRVPRSTQGGWDSQLEVVPWVWPEFDKVGSPFFTQVTAGADAAVGQPYVRLRRQPHYPLYVTGFRFYDALTADTSTTRCPLAWLKWETCREMLERYWSLRPYDRATLEQDMQRVRGNLVAAQKQFKPKRRFSPYAWGAARWP